MAFTAADIQEAVRLEVYSAEITDREFIDITTSDPGAGGTSLNVADTNYWSVGDIGEFDDGEQVLVTAVPTGSTLTILRGHNGTTAAAHAVGSVMTKNPRFSRAQIDSAFQHVLEDLRPDLYELATETLVYDPTTRWYPFSGGTTDRIFDVLTVYYKPNTVDHPVAAPLWKYLHGVLSAVFTGSHGIWVPGLEIATSDNFYVAVKKAVTGIADVPDDWKSMMIMGVVYHLMGAQNVIRTHDPGKRTDRTVQPGQEGRDSIWYLREYMRRKDRLTSDLENRAKDLPLSRTAMRAKRWQV